MNLKNSVLCFTILLVACGVGISATENVSSSEANYSSAATENGWKVYHDDRFGFTIKYPEVVSDDYGNRWQMTIQQNQNGIEYGYHDSKYSRFRPIIIGSAKSDQEILDFIHSFKRFGVGCTFKKTILKDGASL